MRTDPPRLVHVVGADTPPERLQLVARLAARGDLGFAQSIVHYDGGPRLRAADDAPLPPAQRIRSIVGVPSRMARRLLDLVGAAQLVHAWSPRALHACLGAAARTAREPRAATADASRNPSAILVDADLAHAARDLARWDRARDPATRVDFACPTLLARRRLLEAGVPPQRSVVLRDSVDFAALQRDRAAAGSLRQRLGIDARQRIAVALPPVTRAGGAYYAAWAAMLVEKVVPELRLIVPDGGSDAPRVRRLVDACRHAHVVRFAPCDAPLTALLALADVALFLPVDDAPLHGVNLALAAGTPIVASAIPASTELLVHGVTARLCRPRDPRDAARRLLEALDRPEESRRTADEARLLAFRLFSVRRQVEQYQRAYSNAAAGREIGEGVDDPLVAAAAQSSAAGAPVTTSR